MEPTAVGATLNGILTCPRQRAGKFPSKHKAIKKRENPRLNDTSTVVETRRDNKRGWRVQAPEDPNTIVSRHIHTKNRPRFTHVEVQAYARSGGKREGEPAAAECTDDRVPHSQHTNEREA